MAPALPLQQHPAFGRALAALGQRAECVDLGAGGEVLVVRRRLPVVGDVGYLPRGPIWTDGMAPDDRAAVLGRLSVRLIEAEAPCPSLRAAGFRQVATAAHVAELGLEGTPAGRRAGLNGKWRNALRGAERAPLAVTAEAFDGDGDHWLLAREAEMRRERRYRALPQALACAYARATPGAARLYAAHERGEPVAGMLVLLHHPVATYHLGWTGERGRAASAHHILLMRAADDLAAAGFARLDLGIVDTEAAPGLARFKIGAGARVRALGGSWLRLPLARGVALRGPRR